MTATAGGVFAGDGWEDSVHAVLQSSQNLEARAEEITSLFSRADHEQVPYNVLLPRLEEGAAKRVSPDQIIAVLERELDAYVTAKEIIIDALGEEPSQRLLTDVTPWSRTVTLLLQGTGREELTRLLQAFSRQDTDDRWRNYRYGCSLYVALLRWGMEKEQSLEIIAAAAQSYIPAGNYKGILDTLSSGTRLRVAPETMANRMIQVLPGIRSLEELHDLVLY